MGLIIENGILFGVTDDFAEEELIIPDGVTKIRPYSFMGKSIKKVIVPEGITDIFDGTFYECNTLEEVQLPLSLRRIWYLAFNKCVRLRSIVIPEGVTQIGSNAFSECILLKSVQIPKGITEIDDCLFRRCRVLQSISIPDGVTRIGRMAFSSCINLESVTIPESVTVIDTYAFEECGGLKSLAVPGKLSFFGEKAFSGQLVLSTPFSEKIDADDFKGLSGVSLNPERFAELLFFQEGKKWEKLRSEIKLDNMEKVISALCDLLNNEKQIPKKTGDRLFEFYSKQKKKIGKGLGDKFIASLARVCKSYASFASGDQKTAESPVVIDGNKRIVKVTGSGKTLELPIADAIAYDALADCDYKMIKVSENNKLPADWLEEAKVSKKVETISVPVSVLVRGFVNKSFSEDIQRVVKTTGKCKADERMKYYKMLLVGLKRAPDEVASECVKDKMCMADFCELFRPLLPRLDDVDVSEGGLKSIKFDKPTEKLLEVYTDTYGYDDQLPRLGSGDEIKNYYIIAYLVMMIEPVEDSKAVQLLSLFNREELTNFLMIGYDVDTHYAGAPDISPLISAIVRTGTPADVSLLYSDCLTMESRSWSEDTSRYRMAQTFRKSIVLCNNKDTLLMMDKRKGLQYIADKRGVNVEDLRASLLSSVEEMMNEDGTKCFDYGPRMITAILLPNMKFVFKDSSTDKTSKSLPKSKFTDNVKSAEEAAKSFKELNDNVKNISKQRIDQINTLLYKGRSLRSDEWKKKYLSGVIVKILSMGILWGVYDSKDNLKLSFRTDNKGNCFDVDNNPVEIGRDKLIGVVDASQLSDELLEAWRSYFWGEHVMSAVRQFEAPAKYIPLECVEQRYANCRMPVGYAKGAFGYNGWMGDGGVTMPGNYMSIEFSSVESHQNSGWLENTGFNLKIHRDFDRLNDHEKRLWNRDIIHFDSVLHPEKQIEPLIQAGDIASIKSFVDTKLITPDNITDLTGFAIKEKQVEISAYLLELKKKWLGDLQDPFSDYIL